MKKNLQSQYALRNDQFPRTVSLTADVLTNHQWDDKYRITDKKKKEHSGGNRSTGNEKEKMRSHWHKLVIRQEKN